MRFFKNTIPLVLLAGLLLVACRKDVIIDNATPVVSPPTVMVEGGVIGLILDENSNPVSDALIELNDHEFQTDSSGVFFLNHLDLNESGALVTVEKAGYFKGSRRFYPSLGTKNYMEIKLLPKTPIISLNASMGGTVPTVGGATIELPAGSIIDENGDAYLGEVVVFVRHLDPTSEDFAQIMPGSLEGKNKEGEIVALESYGMLAVELETPTGQRLNLGNEKKAQLIFPVPVQLRGTAPAEIPLWFFDEEEEIWIEEGRAAFDGSNYVGEVSHFSFWNCDEPYPLIELSGCFIDQGGFPIVNKKVKITNLSTGNSGFGMTNDEGCFKGKVPQNQLLKLELLSDCSVSYYAEEIGSFSENTHLGTKQASNYVDQFFVTTFTGRAVDCFGEVITEDVILEINSGDRKSYYVVDGEGFDATIDYCANLDSFSVKVILITDELSKASSTYWVIPNSTPQTVGDLVVCGNDESYFKITLDGESFTYCDLTSNGAIITLEPDSLFDIFAAQSTRIPADTTIMVFTMNMTDWEVGTTVVLDDTNTGSNPGNFSYINLSGAFQLKERIFVHEIDENFKVTLHKIEEKGGYVEGTIEINAEYGEADYDPEFNTIDFKNGSPILPVNVVLEFKLLRLF